MSGFTAYHGSPFLFDRLDLAHALSGEGHHTYGRGIYVTDLREGAEKYARGHFVYVDGREAMFLSPLLNNRRGTVGCRMLDNMLAKHFGDLDAAAADAALLAASGGDLTFTADQYREAVDAAAPLMGRVTTCRRGFIYTLHVKAERGDFHDVDIPPDEQTSSAAGFFAEGFAKLRPHQRGFTVRQQHGFVLGNTRNRGTPLEPTLVTAGCPGLAICYPERGATDFVVFDADLVEITAVAPSRE